LTRKCICILSFSNIAWDGRVLREIDYARREYSVDVIGYGDWVPPEGVQYFQIPKTKRTNLWLMKFMVYLAIGKIVPSFYQKAFWIKKEYSEAKQIIQNGSYDLIHANDWDGLPVGAKAVQSSETKLLWDAHEYSLVQEDYNHLWKYFVTPFRQELFIKSFNNVDKMIDASVEYGRLYKEVFGWDSTTILNVPVYQEVQFRPCKPERIQIIHHGVAMPNRCLEEMIQMIALTDTRYHLNFMLVSTHHPKYTVKLQKFADEIAPGRVTFQPAVEPAKIVETISYFDLGLPLLKVRQVSHLNSQPNKFFEYIMAGLGIITPPFPGMAPIVSQNGNGMVAPEYTAESVAQALNNLTENQINDCKRASLRLAHQYNADVELGKLMSIYHSLVTNNDYSEVFISEHLRSGDGVYRSADR